MTAEIPILNSVGLIMYKNIYYDFMEGRVVKGMFLAHSLHVEFFHVALNQSKHSIQFIRNQ